MRLQQLSLFLENRPGTLHAPLRALAEAGVNVLAVSLADSSQFGVLRLVVAEQEQAKRVLEDVGMVVRATEVVPIEVDDEPGGLASAVASLEASGLAVEYMYHFGRVCCPGKMAIILRFDDPDAAVAALEASGVRVLSREDLLAS